MAAHYVGSLAKEADRRIGQLAQLENQRMELGGVTRLGGHVAEENGTLFAIEQVLRDKVDDYPKSVVTKLILEPAIGDSLFVAEGAQWMWQRRTAAPVFSHRNVSALGTVMSAAAERA